MTTETGSIFGKLYVSGADTAWPAVEFDRIALDEFGRLLFASVLADSGIVKGIRAILNCDKRVTISATGIKVKKASAAYPRNPPEIAKTESQYATSFLRLEYGLVHAFFQTRMPGFMLALTDEHLWAELTDTRFTTPLLPEWTGYIKARLMEKGLLAEAACYRCECALLTATTADLDLIVSEGIRSGMIRIPRKHVA